MTGAQGRREAGVGWMGGACRAMLAAGLVLALTVVSASGCRCGSPLDTGMGLHGQPDKDGDAELPDGFYMVQRSGESLDAVLPVEDGSRVVEYTREFEKEDTEGSHEFLVVADDPDVPILLDGPPRSVKGDDGRTLVRLSFTQEAGRRLERFTTEHHGRERVAVIIGGKVITVHKIRTTIDGGQLQVACCSPGACEHLFSSLRDNVASIVR